MKNLFEISSEEKQRILELYLGNTKRPYLFEQLKKINIKVTDGKDPVVGAAIIDLGDKTNGGTTDIDGKLTLPKFFGPSFKVVMTGFKEIEVTPDNENVNVTMEPSDITLSGVEIKAKDFYGKVIDSETKKPIIDALIVGINANLEDDKEFKWRTNDKGEFKSGIGYNPLTISSNGYDSLEYKIKSDYVFNEKKPTVIELTKKYVPPVVPTELEFLIGKVFRFLDSKMKRPGWFKILEAQYVEDGNRTTTQLTTSYCQVQNKCDETPSFTIIYDCDRIAFKVQKISDAWSRKVIDFVIKNYLYCDDLQTYLLDNSKTKTCTLNKP